MISLDRDLSVKWADREFSAQFRGASRDISGQSFLDFLHPCSREVLQYHFSCLLRGEEVSFTSQAVMDKESEMVFTGALTASSMAGGEGTVSAIVILMESPHRGSGADAEVTAGREVLTPLEARLLEGTATGLSTIALAARVHLSRQGVEYHLARIRRRLRAPNRAALISRAYSKGMLKVGSWPPKVTETFIK